jgi:RNA polymerase sigma factor (sigma-70 family)
VRRADLVRALSQRDRLVRYHRQMSRADRRSDNELLLAASRDPEAFGLFYDRYAIALIQSLRRRTGSSELALDLAAEVFATVLERSAAFTPREEHSARAWLYAIARNQLVDFYRRGKTEDAARRRLGVQSVVLDETETELLERRLDAADQGLLEALEGLPVDEREAVLGRVVEESDYGSLADRLQVSQSVVRQRVSRGLRRLRLSIKEPS